MANVTRFFTEASNLICSWPLAPTEWRDFVSAQRVNVEEFHLITLCALHPFSILQVKLQVNTEGAGYNVCLFLRNHKSHGPSDEPRPASKPADYKTSVLY